MQVRNSVLGGGRLQDATYVTCIVHHIFESTFGRSGGSGICQENAVVPTMICISESAEDTLDKRGSALYKA